MKVEINPDGFGSEYLANINLAFDGWGDEKLYQWVFTRTAGSRRADQIVLRDDDGAVLAGSAVSYRTVRGPGDGFDVGIMTGSWTLPAARGQGCFGRIITESCDLCTSHDDAFLLAFVTHDNASRRRLEAAGSVMVPSRYIFTDDDQDVPAGLEAREVELDAEALWGRVEDDRGDEWHFHYPTLEDFVGQCVHRSHPTRCLMVGNAVVLLEETANADRVVVASYGSQEPASVLAAVARRAHDADRRFFAFAIGDLAVEGLAHKEGFLTILPTLDGDARIEPDAVLDWRIDAGDRM